MKNSKNVLALILALVMVFGLAACGSKSAAPVAEPAKTDAAPAAAVKTIQWYCPNWDEPEAREMVAEFEAANPDVKVELVITDWDTYKSRVTTALIGKDVPELYTVLLTDVKPFAKLGLLEGLNTLGADAGIDFAELIKASMDIVSIDGQSYAIPFRYDGSGIYYNVDMLKAAGYETFPETWDGMLEMSAKLKESGTTAFCWPLGNQANAVTRLVQQLYTYGGTVLTEDQKTCLLNSEEAKKALSAIKETIDLGYASASSLEVDNTIMRDMFGNGQIAFNLSGPFDVDTLVAEYPELNFATATIPGIDGMGVTTANGWCVVMSSGCDNKVEAARFLQYITTPDNQIRLTDSFPASYTALENEKFSSDYLKPFAAQLDNSLEEPSYDRWAEIEPIIFQYIQAAIGGTMSVDEACEAMTADINALLAY